MKKKTLAALLAALLALMLVLSACGNSNAKDDEAPPAEDQTGQTADEEAEDAAAPRLYKEVRWYDEEGELCGIDYVGEDLRLIGFESRNGNYTNFEELRMTDACDAIDTADIAAIPGVTAVEVRQYFSTDSKDAPFTPSDFFGVFGYNAQGALLGMQAVTMVEGRPVVRFTAVYTTGADGSESGMKRFTTSGELLSEAVDENTFDDDGNIVRKIVHWTYYGRTHFVDGEYVFEAYDEPETKTQTAEYVY